MTREEYALETNGSFGGRENVTDTSKMYGIVWRSFLNTRSNLSGPLKYTRRGFIGYTDWFVNVQMHGVNCLGLYQTHEAL